MSIKIGDKMPIMKLFYNKFKLFSFLFLLGGATYSAIELLWRGRTHYSMCICGGLCLCMIYQTGTKLKGVNILKLALICSLFITLIELIFGLIFNMLLKMSVWDYSMRNMNFYGQICPIFSFCWFLLSIPTIYICRFIKKCLD